MVLNAGADKISMKAQRRHIFDRDGVGPPAVYINGKGDSTYLTSIDKSGARPGVLPNAWQLEHCTGDYL